MNTLVNLTKVKIGLMNINPTKVSLTATYERETWNQSTNRQLPTAPLQNKSDFIILSP